MPTLFKFEIYTPYRRFFSESVEAVLITLADGEICIYANHSNFVAPSLSCILRIKNNKGEWQSAFVSEGIIEVKQGRFRNVLIVDSAEWPREIDPIRARAAKEQAEKSLESAMMKFEKESAKTKLRRAEYRLKAYELKVEGQPRS